MKNLLIGFIIILFLSHFNNTVFAQTSIQKPTACFPCDTITITARLVDSVGVIPYCGYILVRPTFHYQILSSRDSTLKGQTISIMTCPCPREKYGADYFQKGKVYVLRIKRQWVSLPPFVEYEFSEL